MGDIPTEQEDVTKKERVMRPLYISPTTSHSTSTHKCAWLRKKWFKRTLLERIFIVILIIILIILFALCIAVHIYRQREVIDLCLTKDCVTTAAFILNSVDSDAEPCDDFYDFACGSFINKALVPDKPTVRDFTFEEPYVGIFSMKQEMFLARLKAMMEEQNNMSDPNSLWKARTLYTSCMNTEMINDLGFHPLDEVMDGFGGWPVIKGPDWEEEHFNWIDVLYKFYTKGLTTSVLFDVHVKRDEKNTDHNIIKLEKPYLAFPIDYEKEYQPHHLLNDSRVITYYHYIVNTSVALGANRTRAEEEVKKLVEFESEIAQAIAKDSYMETEVRLKISDLGKLLPQLDWTDFFGTVMPEKVKSDQMVIVPTPNLGKVLELVKEKPKRLIADFMMWRLVKDNLLNLGEPQQNLFNEYEVHSDEESPRWFTCLSKVWENILTPAAVYVRRYMKAEDREKVEEIFSAIKDQLKDVIENLDGLKDLKREEALEVLESIQHHVFPDEFLQDKVMDEYYSELSVGPDEYLHNLFKVKKFSRDAEFREIKRPSQSPHWAVVSYPLAVNLYISGRVTNAIEIPFNMLVGFNFESDRPRYVNYATLGTYLGSQMIFTFPEEVRDAMFPERDKCTIVQISSKVVPAFLQANVEVIGALRLVYKAYEKWVSNHGDEQELPSLPFTPMQMFWISDATLSCSKYQEDSGYSEYVKARINGPMSNLEEFSHDFQCESGSAMNPVEKCPIW